MGKLDKKIAVVTGAASGMGKSISKLFAKEGAQVILADLDMNDINHVLQELKSDEIHATGFVCDVSHEENVTNLMQFVEKKFGGIDILVNNAGVMDDFTPADQVSNELWNRIIGINLNGPFYTCRLALSLMVKQGKGNIINISSIGGLFGSRAGAAYTTSKHGLIGLTKNIGFMYAQKGIRCNAIAPGGVNTNIGKNMKPDPFGYEKCISGAAGMPRMGEADEIAKTALFLASDESSFINGTVLTADGGWTAY